MPVLPEAINHTTEAIYRAYAASRDEGERTYLGMSTFGTECDRALWYGWRKAYPPEVFEGRKIRLFETGHREESRLIADLRLIGVKVDELDPATGEQFAVSAVSGHVKGHLDGLATGVPDAPKALHVVECKTHNEKSFKALLKDGIEKSKPGHYAQMQLYMHHVGAERALYVAVNKNDDSLHVERVKYDITAALRLLARAERIVGADKAPAKLHDDPKSKAAFACGWCPAYGVCHDGEFARVNCRTCLHSTPVMDRGDAVWRCERWGRDLTVEEQLAGCAAHLYLPRLVPGEQIDASERERTVTYRLWDGAVWVDGAAAGKVAAQ